MATLFNKWLLVALLPFWVFNTGSFEPEESQFLIENNKVSHPFHVSVVEVNHNSTDKTLEISCKIFTDDFEKVLAQNYKTKVDLINPPNKPAMDSLVKKYLFSHLSLKANGKPVAFSYVGFENESEAAYGYLEVVNIPLLSKLEVNISLMYDLFDDQVNIMHVIVNGNRKSTKLNYPQKETSFAW